MIRIAWARFEFCAKEWIEFVTQKFESLFDLQPSTFTFAKGFESITRKFESSCLVLHNSRFKNSNRCGGDSNLCFNLYTCSSWGIRITVWVIRIDGYLLHFFLHQRFESFDWRLESVNLNNLTGIWIRIASWRIWIAFASLNFLELGFESPFEGFESPSSNLLELL